MANPFLDREKAKTVNKGSHGGKSEKRVMKKLGFQTTPGSGAHRGNKGDGKKKDRKLGKLLAEAKSTVHASFTLDLGILVKIGEEALSTGATPIVTINFVDSEGKTRRHGGWVMVRDHTWQELTEEGE